MVAEVNSQGAVVRTIGEGILHDVHDPEMLPNGNILAALIVAASNTGHAIEINSNSNAIVWQFTWPRELLPQLTADANRLPNGNTLIVGKTKMIEVTSTGEIVWQLGLKGISFSSAEEAVRLGLWKADRVSAGIP
jgi:hypothetical protein